MPLRINTLPNKSIHPGSSGSAGSREVRAGAGGRVSMAPGAWMDGVGEGYITPLRAAVKTGFGTHPSSASHSAGSRDGAGWSGSLRAGSGAGKTDGPSRATLLHLSGKREESRSPNGSSASSCAGSGRGGPEKFEGPVREPPRPLCQALQQPTAASPAPQFLPREVGTGVTRSHV